MTLGDMCIMAARFSDRWDEFELVELDDGTMGYEDDALMYFQVFRDGINEAYFEVARQKKLLDRYRQVQVRDDGTVRLDRLSPECWEIESVQDENQEHALSFTFQTRSQIVVDGTQPGDMVTVHYYYVPERLEKLNDEPVLTEAQVDPMVYVSLAVARMWLSEKKLDYYNAWMAQYYTYLRGVRSRYDGNATRRIPRRRFR